MKRLLFSSLQLWLAQPARKPLILRGARQVGKTWLIRKLAETANKYLIELNFEKNPQLASLFQINDAKKIFSQLTALNEMSITPGNSLLFLDEIQAMPEVLSKLRWFAEELPELPVAATGSLLEFVLADHSFSMPVGRISYAHLEPFSFQEFLEGQHQGSLVQFLKEFTVSDTIPDAIHTRCMAFMKEYFLIGGMPAAVKEWSLNKNLNSVHALHHDLLATYRDDFSKYTGKIPVKRLDHVLRSIPLRLGQKFKYSTVDPDLSSTTIKHALELLLKARLCHKVQHTSANGIPLGAEVHEKHFKMIFLDIGLVTTSLGLQLQDIESIAQAQLVHLGNIAEQYVGQALRTLFPFYQEPELYYWIRETKGAEAEVDYLLQYRDRIIPVEVKSGSSGSMKALHAFMYAKKAPLAVRIYAGPVSLTPVHVKLHDQSEVSYPLLSLPFYLVDELPRLLGLISNARV